MLQVLQEKINCHIGFILECFVESFPQSVLQMVAILQISASSDSTANAIIVSSIFLSLLSIAFKSVMLLAVADLWTSIFNWIAAIVDFFTVFVITAWLFLDIQDNHTLTSTENLQWFTMILASATTLPFIGLFVARLFVSYLQDEDFLYSLYSWESCCSKVAKLCCNGCLLSCFFVAMVILLALAVTMGHIMCCSMIALYLYKFGIHRCPDSNGGQLWAPIFRFIHQSHNARDKLVKILIINMSRAGSGEFHAWLKTESQNGFADVGSFKALRQRIYREPFVK